MLIIDRIQINVIVTIMPIGGGGADRTVKYIYIGLISQSKCQRNKGMYLTLIKVRYKLYFFLRLYIFFCNYLSYFFITLKPIIYIIAFLLVLN